MCGHSGSSQSCAVIDVTQRTAGALHAPGFSVGLLALPLLFLFRCGVVPVLLRTTASSRSCASRFGDPPQPREACVDRLTVNWRDGKLTFWPLRRARANSEATSFSPSSSPPVSGSPRRLAFHRRLDRRLENLDRDSRHFQNSARSRDLVLLNDPSHLALALRRDLTRCHNHSQVLRPTIMDLQV